MKDILFYGYVVPLAICLVFLLLGWVGGTDRTKLKKVLSMALVPVLNIVVAVFMVGLTVLNVLFGIHKLFCWLLNIKD